LWLSSPALQAQTSADDLGSALNATNLVWGVSGAAPWLVETTNTVDGVAAVQSGAIPAGQSATLYTVLQGPGTLSFWWSATNQFVDYGTLSLAVDWATLISVYGTRAWEQRSVALGPGAHVVRWTYAKDPTYFGSQDAAWIDEVAYTGPPGPFSVFCPSNMAVVAGSGQATATVNYPTPIATPGATVLSSPASGSAFPLGDTSVAVAATQGTNTASCAFTVSVLAPDDLARALGTTNLSWGAYGDAPWVVETQTTPGSLAAAQTSAVAPGQAATLYTVLQGPGTLDFWWSVFSPLPSWNPSSLSLNVDRVTQATISGTVGWEEQLIDLGTGTHFVEWTLAWDTSLSWWFGVGYVAQVAYTGQPGPFSLLCPFDTAALVAPGQLSVNVWYAQPLATPGATVNASPPPGSVFPLGDTSVAVAATQGTNVASCQFTVSVLATNDLGRAVGASNLSWTTGGYSDWFAETAVTHDGPVAAQSGAVENGGSSSVQTVVTGPGVLSFWWKVSSSAGHGFLYVAVNGATNASISGAIDWQPVTLYLPAGQQVITWTYAKDFNMLVSAGTGWLDTVSYLPGPAAPAILSQPADVSTGLGMSATFSVVADGMPPLSYQWRLNGQSLGGATNATLVITNVGASDLGRYSVLVMNQFGSVFSSSATLSLEELLAWGVDNNGQTNVPANLTNIVAVTGGGHGSAALRADGTVLAWGDNSKGQTNVPPNLTNAVAISSRSGDHIMALQKDGTVVVWGDNSSGQTNVPPGLSNVVAIAAGSDRCLALKADGTAVSWGGSTAVPTGLNNVVAVAAGDMASLFLCADGTVAATGTTPPAGLSNVMGLAAGGLHNLALRAGGVVLAWGDNTYDQTAVPSGLTNVVAVSAGDYHSLALRADGTVVAWGKYYDGETFLPAAPPTGLTNVVAIAAGSDHDVALLGDHPPSPALRLQSIACVGGCFSASLATESGRVYRLEYKDRLEDAVWTAQPLAAGDGHTQIFSDATAAGAQRFYRICRW
jgi:alpha-tubulin suppressor-like RCC1 family protein